MDEKDRKIRKQWLVIWALSLVIAVVSVFLQLRFDTSSPFSMTARYVIATFSLLGAVGFSFAVYHCSYRKPGTKILVFCLIVTGISLVISPLFYLSGRMQPPPYIPYYGIYFLLTQAMGIYWAVLCWKMRKINQRLRAASA